MAPVTDIRRSISIPVTNSGRIAIAVDRLFIVAVAVPIIVAAPITIAAATISTAVIRGRNSCTDESASGKPEPRAAPASVPPAAMTPTSSMAPTSSVKPAETSSMTKAPSVSGG
jgi:hypothetical protein